MNRFAEQAAFVAQLKESPYDPITRAVFADWLEEQNDYRAAWVRDPVIWAWMAPDARHPFIELQRALGDVKEWGLALTVLRRIGLPIVPQLCDYIVWRDANATISERLTSRTHGVHRAGFTNVGDPVASAWRTESLRGPAVVARLWRSGFGRVSTGVSTLGTCEPARLPHIADAFRCRQQRVPT